MAKCTEHGVRVTLQNGVIRCLKCGEIILVHDLKKKKKN